MRCIVETSTWVVALLSALLLATATIALSAEHSHKHKHSGSGKELIEEMRALDAAFREIVSAVAVGDGHRAAVAIEGMHGKMEKTQEALGRGEVRLRKNASRLKEFERMDKEFHEGLASLGRAAHSGDSQKMAALTKKLLDGCVSCHAVFRP